MSSSASRLSRVANQRRRQRKERLAANKDKIAASDTPGSNNIIAKGVTTPRQTKGNVVDKFQKTPLACAPTESCTFDDSTISSAGTWFPGGQSTITDGSGSEFADGQTILEEERDTFVLPMTILSPTAEKSKKNGATTPKAKPNKTAKDSRPAVVRITTPRQKKLSSYHAAKQRLRGGASSVSSASAKSSVVSITTASIHEMTSRNENTGSASAEQEATPKTKCPTPRHKNTTPKHNSSHLSTPLHVDTCSTPRNSNSSTPRTSDDNFAPPPSPSAATPEQVMLMRLERDRLRADVATFRRKLQSANETKDTTLKGKNDTIMELENKLQHVTKEMEKALADLEGRLKSKSKELELSKSQTRCAKLQTQEIEQKMNDETKLKGTMHQKKLLSVEKRLQETSEELSRVNNLLKEMTNERYSVDKESQTLMQQLLETKKRKDEVEDNWNECLNRLDKMELEYEENYEQHAKREAKLKESLEEVQQEKKSSSAETKRTLTSIETQLATAIEEKRDMEKSLQDQISDLQSELQMQRHSSDNVKRHHAKIVEGLKSDLHKARQLREESASSMQQDMEEMKTEYDESMSYYKSEVENLRTQLRSTKSRADADRKEWMSTLQPQYERKLETINNQKEEIEVDLAQARKEVECLKSVRDKDIELLESELNVTYKAKVELDAEVKDTKRQLHNALRNLDEMTFDGGKMRSDLEGVMNEFSSEKRYYQKEMDHLKRSNEDQRKQLDETSRNLSQHEELLKENKQLQQEIDHLKSSNEEQKCKIDALKRSNDDVARNHRQHDVEADQGREMLIQENLYLKNRLETAEHEAAHFSADAVAAAAAAAEATYHNHSELSEHKAAITQLQTENLNLSTLIAHHTESMEQLRVTNRDASAQLSRANQTIQILKSKERYLESRVESLASQISKTVKDYEMKLTSSASGESTGAPCSSIRDMKETNIRSGDSVGSGDSGGGSSKFSRKR